MKKSYLLLMVLFTTSMFTTLMFASDKSVLQDLKNYRKPQKKPYALLDGIRVIIVQSHGRPRTAKRIIAEPGSVAAKKYTLERFRKERAATRLGK